MDALTPLPPPPNPIQTLSGIMGIKQQQQALQTGQYTQQSAQANSQIDQMKASQAQAASNLVKNADKYKGADGNFDNQKFANDVSTVAPLLPELANSATARAGEVYKNKQTLLNLNNSERETIGNAMGAWAADPTMTHTKLIDGVESLRDQFKDNPDVSRMLTSMTTAMPNTDGPQLQQSLRNAAIMAKSPTAEQTNPAVGTYQGAHGIQAFQNNPQAVGGVANVGSPLGPQGIAPQVVTTPSGSLQVWGPNGAGGGKGSAAQAGGGPRTAAQDAPPPNAPKQVQDAYQQAVTGTNSHVDAVRTADESYGNNMAISNAIRQLSKGADTGPGTNTWNHVMGILGTDKANNAQELGAFLDRQAATVRGQMGLPGTNAGAEDAKSIVGNTGYNAKVIQDKNDYTQALTEGLHQYRNGLDRIAGFSGQASPAAVNQYKSQWAQNFDPNVYKGELAYKRSKVDGDAFVKSLSPDEAKSLAAKRAALQSLSKGQLSQ